MYSICMDTNERLRRKVEAYRPGAHALAVLRQTPILILSAISGAGKDAVKFRLLEKYASQYHHVISHITRPQRSQHGVMERDGFDYHFISTAAAETMLDQQAYIEVDWYVQNVYGTSVEEIEKAHAQNKIAITDITIVGADHVAELTPTAKPVFLFPPSFEEWQRRLLSRYGDDHQDHAADIRGRMEIAMRELAHAVESNRFYLVVNDDLEKTVELVNRIAHGEAVEPHYHKAQAIAEEILQKLHDVLAKEAAV